MSWEDYDRITDTLMYFSDTLVLNFTVSLSRKDKSGGRTFFHYETNYQSKYIGTNSAKAIKRNMNFFFTFEDKNDFGNGFIFRMQDVAMLVMLIEQQMLPLYFDAQKRVFKVIDDQLVLVGKYNPIVFTQSEYKYLMFEPIVCKYEDGSFKEGVRMTLNSKSNYVDMDIDKFMGFYYLMKQTDMYAVACSMVHYVKTPPYDTNIYRRQGLGGGAPLPDWNSNEDDNDQQQKRSNSKTNNFLDNIKKKE